MINAIKSIANSFKTWARPKNRRPVLVPLAPVQQPDDTAAVDKARRELLATLGAVLDKKRADFDAAIEEVKQDLFDFMRNGLHAECLLETLHKLHFHTADDFDDDELSAFAAAVDYFYYGGFNFTTALKTAGSIISSGDYMHYPDIDDYYKLGRKIADKELESAGIYRPLPELVDDYVNYERLGEDYANDHAGKFTAYGFFAPQEDD